MAKPYLTGGCRVQLGYGLAQVQKLKLALTPQLRQSLAVLQLSAVDLVAFLQQQADENPLLNVDARDELAWLGDEERRAEARGEPTEDDAVDWAAYLEDPGFRESAAAWSEDEDPLARATRSDKTLFSVLAEQLRYASVSEPVRRAALFLAGNLTDAGYLDVSLEEAAAASGTDVVTMRQALDVLQSLDPPAWGRAICANACSCSWHASSRVTPWPKPSCATTSRIWLRTGWGALPPPSACTSPTCSAPSIAFAP